MVNSNFPPSTKRKREIDVLLALLKSVVPDNGVVYLSAPITSGKRFTIWLEKNSQHVNLNGKRLIDDHFRDVIEPNRLHARLVVKKLRKALKSVLIDPTSVDDFPGWTQDDYRYFWARVIEQYANTVIFLDGWQFSLGCSYEFLTACERGVKTLDEKLKPISPNDGLSLLNLAIKDLNPDTETASFLRSVVNNLAHVAS